MYTIMDIPKVNSRNIGEQDIEISEMIAKAIKTHFVMNNIVINKKASFSRIKLTVYRTYTSLY